MKSEMLRVRLSDVEAQYLQKKADELKISVSEYVRRRLFETAPRVTDPPNVSLR